MNETVTLADFRTEANFIKEAAGKSGGPEKKVSLGPGTTLIRHWEKEKLMQNNWVRSDGD